MMPGPDQHATHAVAARARPPKSACCRNGTTFFQNTLRWRNLRKITIAQVSRPGVLGRADA
jgi:enoyl-CoA hydratase